MTQYLISSRQTMLSDTTSIYIKLFSRSCHCRRVSREKRTQSRTNTALTRKSECTTNVHVCRRTLLAQRVMVSMQGLCSQTFLCSPRQVSVDLQKAERTEHQTEEIACSTYLPSYKSSAFLPMVRVIRLTNHNMKGWQDQRIKGLTV